MGASLDFGLMFGHFDFHRRQIENLTPFYIRRSHMLQPLLAMTALFHRMLFYVFRSGNQLQSVTLVIGLTPIRLVALLAIVLRFRFLISVTGRRFVAVTAALRHLCFQLPE